jgi:iron complex transport system substrate-binding protein
VVFSRIRVKQVVVLFVLLSLLAGCGAEQPKAAPVPAAPKPDPIKITDQLNRTIELPAVAKRVIGTHNPSLNMVVVLDGKGTRFAGFGNKDMAYRLYEIVAPEVNTAKEVGRGKTLNMETVASVKPDLMILPARFKSQVDDLKPLNIPCIVLDVEKFDSIKDALKIVGKAIGQTPRATEIVSFFDQKTTDIKTLAAKATKKPTVLMLSGSSKTAVSTDAMLQNLMIETAGGKNVTAGYKADELWTEVNIEQIIKWNPEVIFVPVYASYKVEDILKDPAWSKISAVRNKKVYLFPSNMEPWDYPVAAASLGLCWTCYTLHPELYSYDSLIKDVNQFYQLVYGKTFTPEQLGLKK